MILVVSIMSQQEQRSACMYIPDGKTMWRHQNTESAAYSANRSDETPHQPHCPQIFNILLTSNRTGATVRVHAMNTI